MRRYLKQRASLDSSSRLTLSFIDITAGGFGAAALLAAILFAIPITGASGRLGSEQFIHLLVYWENPDVLMELIVHTPRGETLRLLQDPYDGLKKINPFTGRVATHSNDWQAALVVGDSSYGSNSLEGGSGNTRNHTRWLSLRIIAPCPTEEDQHAWSFDLAVRKTMKTGIRLSDLSLPYTAKLYTADSKAQGGPLVTAGTLLGQNTLSEGTGSDPGGGQTGVELLWQSPGVTDNSLTAGTSKVRVSARSTDNLDHCEARSSQAL